MVYPLVYGHNSSDTQQSGVRQRLWKQWVDLLAGPGS